MQYAPLGRTGLNCSRIGLGTWAFASQAYRDVSEAEACEAVRIALDLGINFFDSAPLYGVGSGPDARDGVAEEVLGRALGADRDRAIISTKFGRNPSTGIVPTFTAAQARRSVDESLRRMGVDHIDVLFFHSPFSPDDIHDDVWEGLNDVRDEGKVRFVGHSISMFRDTEGMARDWVAQRKIDVIQVVYSLMNREAADVIRDVGAQGCGVVARETLANGFLTGAVTRDTVFPANNLNARYAREEIAERVGYVERLAAALTPGTGLTIAQAALRWALDNPCVSLALTGAKNRSELEDCAAAADAPAFPPETHDAVARMHVKDYPGA